MISGAMADFRSLFCCCLRSRFSAAKALAKTRSRSRFCERFSCGGCQISTRPRIRSRGLPDVVVIRKQFGTWFYSVTKASLDVGCRNFSSHVGQKCRALLRSSVGNDDTHVMKTERCLNM